MWNVERAKLTPEQKTELQQRLDSVADVIVNELPSLQDMLSDQPKLDLASLLPPSAEPREDVAGLAQFLHARGDLRHSGLAATDKTRSVLEVERLEQQLRHQQLQLQETCCEGLLRVQQHLADRWQLTPM